ncbi:hypothetical protein [Paraburkholderia acidisoli]|uniref:Uncharacterized protein n=1 Tax=Paraburkholderia acidisoli TaxID=2571748 RepID=A0A7Z2GSI5_9BURK|nr:hypothetical protein [Paraburkholderia acidisoli]QGZ66955.1 hypothetical protein FAZ98_34535 [Paraburkholderia acidisoli]
MRNDSTPPDTSAAALTERLRIFIYSAALPVSRLALDVEGAERFSAFGDEGSPQMQLVRAMPPFTPAAAEIVNAMVDAFGADLFTDRLEGRLQAVIRFGPVRFAHVILAFEARFPSRPLSALATRFQQILDRHPETGYADAHLALSQIGLPVGGPNAR